MAANDVTCDQLDRWERQLRDKQHYPGDGWYDRLVILIAAARRGLELSEYCDKVAANDGVNMADALDEIARLRRVEARLRTADEVALKHLRGEATKFSEREPVAVMSRLAEALAYTGDEKSEEEAKL